jgi:ppGpp synthetase/RelA/SpoT-type nucleotidyltranferase
MTNLEEARTNWLREQPAFGEFAARLRDVLRVEVRRAGILAEVTSRAKEMDSLIKKLIRKPEHTYESLGDKAGLRVIVRYKHEIAPVLQLAEKVFARGEPENTSDRLKPDTFGYLSVHAAVRLLPGDEKISIFPPDRFSAELQVRTMAQHLWAEMAHDRVYKYDDLIEPLPKLLQRRIYILAGVVELADEEFNRVELDMPSDDERGVLKALERHYYKFTAQKSDPMLSLDVVHLLTPLYHTGPAQIIEHLNDFIPKHQDTLEAIYEKAAEMPDRSAFLFQPEALMIYDLLKTDHLAVREAWSRQFPDRELERMALAFGVSFD